jgi:hypothetical protein
MHPYTPINPERLHPQSEKVPTALRGQRWRKKMTAITMMTIVSSVLYLFFLFY